MRFFGLSGVWILMAVSPACTPSPGELTPSRVLETYIKTSFGVHGVADKKKLEELLTGDTRNRLSAWSDEQFTRAFIGSRKKFLGLRILETKRVSDSEVALTYELSFQEGVQEKAANVTQKKLCSIVKEGDLWKIKEVRSIRESIEYLNEFSLP